MARVHGKNVNLSFDGEDVEGDLRSVALNFEVPEAEITAFADAAGVYLAGKKGASISLEGFYNDDDDSAIDVLLQAVGNGPKSVVFDPTGQGAGANTPEFRCTESGLSGALVENVQMDFPIGAAATFSAQLSHSGSTTRHVS